MKRERKAKQETKKVSNNFRSPKKENLINQSSGNKSTFLWLFLIVVLTTVAYYPTFDNEITSWDDEFYLNDNPYLKDLSAESIKTLFKTDTYYMGNYHPLSMVSLSIDYAIGGEDKNGNINPFLYHLTNLVLHILVSLFVFWFVLLLLKNFNIAVIAALLFGVHTIHVESVAWISERKDVLYAFFFVASLISYLKYVDKKKLVWYFAALLLFLLSLFSKGQAVSLAITIILIDWIRKRNFFNTKLIAEKIPFLALAVIFGLIAIGAQQESEALVDEQGYDFFQRIGIASYAFMQYLYKLVLPINLSAIYPYPDIIKQTIPNLYYLMILPVGFIIYLTIRLFKKGKTILVFGIAFFVANILLLLQFIPVGSAVHADRYAYIPSIGFFILVSALLIRHIKNKPKHKNIIFGLTGMYIILLTALSFMRSDIWQNSETLWTDTIKKSPNSVIAWNNLGSLKDRQAVKAFEELRYNDVKKLRREAIEHFSEAIKGKPDYRNAFYNRGVSKFELGKLNNDTVLIATSIKDFTNALTEDGQFSDAYHYRANAKSELGKLDAAMKDYNLAIDLMLNKESNKGLHFYYSNRGITKGKLGDYDGAIADFDKALSITPEESGAYSNRGRAKMLKGDTEDAIKDFNTAISLDPKHFSAYLNRAVAKQILKDFDGAIIDYTKTIELNPNSAEAYFSRGKLLIIMNKKTEACFDLNKAQELRHPLAEIFIENYCK
ncbi:MAG: tetratricopeptide repeat protein [Bacteroidales bacterium]|nr:tetratricopeptide repeat protein [Bacteroidales bacterium]